MEFKLFYMIGTLVDQYCRLVGFRIINKVTFEIVDVELTDNRLALVENLDYDGREWKCNCGDMQRYTSIDVVRNTALNQKVVIIAHSISCVTIALPNGNVGIVTRDELESIMLACSGRWDECANAKKSNTSTKFIGCIRTPLELIESGDFRDSLRNNFDIAVNMINSRLKARVMASSIASRFGVTINTSRTLSNLTVMSMVLSSRTSLEAVITLIGNENWTKNVIYDEDIVAKLFSKGITNTLQIGPFAIIYDRDSDNYRIDYVYLRANGEIIAPEKIPIFKTLSLTAVESNKLTLTGYIGAFADRKGITVSMDYTNDTAQLTLNYVRASNQTGDTKFYTTVENYSNALKLLNGNSQECSDTIQLNKGYNKVLRAIMAVHKRIVSLTGYLDMGNNVTSKKVVDFDKQELKDKAINADDIVLIVNAMGVRDYKQNIKDDWQSKGAVALNRYDYINCIRIPSGSKLGANIESEWTTTTTPESFTWVIQVYKSGEICKQFLWYTGMKMAKISDVRDVYKLLFGRMFEFNTDIPVVENHSGLRHEYIDIFSDIYKDFRIVPKSWFSGYNPLTSYRYPQFYKVDLEDAKKDTSLTSTGGMWGYGVSIIDGANYIYCTVQIQNQVCIFSKDASLGGLLLNTNRTLGAVPVLKFDTYEHMVTMYREHFEGKAVAAIEFAKWVVDRVYDSRQLAQIDGVVGVLELVKHLIHGTKIDIAAIEKDIGKSIQEAGIIL